MLRFDTSQLPGGTFYDSYAHAGTLAGSLASTRASLVLDSGWGGTRDVGFTSATVSDNTFTAPRRRRRPRPATSRRRRSG